MKSENSVFSAKKVENHKLPFKKLPNYLQFFDYATAYQPAYAQFDEIVKASADPEYIPRQFRISERLRQEGVDPIITGLIDIIQSDPNLRNNIKVTSTYRPGAVTTNGSPSWHAKGLAVDIVPVDGDFASMEKTIMSNPQIVKYLYDNNLGILDEYSDEGVKRNTGSTGKHFHIGRDKLAIQDFYKLLSRYGYAKN